MTFKQSLLLIAAIITLAPSLAHSQQLPGTVPVTTGQTVTPALTNASPGTFLAQNSFSAQYFDSSTSQVVDFVLQEAIFRNSFGAVDFYFQLKTNSSTASFSQVFVGDFGSYATNVGYRPDGSSLPPAAGFTTGTVVPASAHRFIDLYSNNAVGFNFGAGLTGGLISDVLIVSTNASSFTTVGDLGVYSNTRFSPDTANAFGYFSASGPVVAAPVAAPESGSSVWLLSLGLAGVLAVQRIFWTRGGRVARLIA